LKNGHGKEVFSNGDRYIGNYLNGKPENYGEYYWSNGNSYQGIDYLEFLLNKKRIF